MEYVSDFYERKFTERWDPEWDFERTLLRGGNESSGGKLEVENESSEEKMRGAIKNEILEFSTMRIWLKLRIHFCVTFCIESIRIAMNCEKIDNQILLNLDFSKFQEFDNHTLEWKLSQ